MAGDTKEQTFLNKAFKGVRAVICPVVCMQISFMKLNLVSYFINAIVRTKQNTLEIEVFICFFVTAALKIYRKEACTALMDGKAYNM